MSLANNVELTEEIFGEKTIIIAKSGYGKSYTARVMIEEGLQKGVTFVIIDPQGAYDNLKGFDTVHFRSIRKVPEYAMLLASTNKNIVINTQRSTIVEQNDFLKIFLENYRKHRQRGINTLVIDEIHKFAPEQRKTAAKQEVIGLFQEDRSMGQGAIGISQRPARMDKTILAQADNIALGKFKARADIDAIKGYLENKEHETQIKNFKKGEFLLIGFGLDEDNIYQIRKSTTEHSGSSPKHLLNEDTTNYEEQSKHFVRRTKMTDEIATNSNPINRVIPSRKGFIDLFGLGAKVSLGGLVGASVSGFVADKMPVSPVRYVSSRTLGATGSMIGLYALYRFVPSRFARTKDIVMYSAAGSAAFWAGMVFFDVLNLSGARLPAFANFLVTGMTGATPAPMAVRTSGEMTQQSPVDLNTPFA